MAALPAAIVLAELSGRFELYDAWVAIPVALVLGIAALVLARRGGELVRRTIGRVGGEGAARAGRMLGRIAVGIALSGVIAIAVYEALTRFAE